MSFQKFIETLHTRLRNIQYNVYCLLFHQPWFIANRRKNAPQANANGLPRPKRNTENFNPSHEPAQMRVLFAPSGLKKYLDYRSYQTRDVLVVNDLGRRSWNS